MTLFLESFVGSIVQCEDFVFSDTNLSYIFIFIFNFFAILHNFVNNFEILFTVNKHCKVLINILHAFSIL